MMNSTFSLINESDFLTTSTKLPCREQQLRALTTLVSPFGAQCRNVVLHGLEATGKKSVAKLVLDHLSKDNHNVTKNDRGNSECSLRYIFLNIVEYIGSRHLFEQTIGLIAKTLDSERVPGLVGNISEFAVEIQLLIEEWNSGTTGRKRLVLVFDGIDKMRDPLPTLIPAIARMAEMIQSLTNIFIVTCPRPLFLHIPGVPHIAFPSYTKAECIHLITLIKPFPLLPKKEETKPTWCRFTMAVYDSISKHCGRDIISFRDLCLRLWPLFTQPIISGDIEANPFSRLMVANRHLFQDDSDQCYTNIADLLPSYSRLLLTASYLASFNPSRNDALFFIKKSADKRRKKGGGTALTSSKPGVSKSRKIPRKLLGAQAFVLERMLAIFHTILEDSDIRKGTTSGFTVRRSILNGSADVQMGLATLVSLRLLVRIGNLNAGDILDAGMKILNFNHSKSLNLLLNVDAHVEYLSTILEQSGDNTFRQDFVDYPQ
ncbi:BgTH12-01284 [Blumeria graminis f. sp. triticale]|uniref:BgTH12-01284 n=1 Tax=Blumeria graminis f. sp. triticale TaxID=1689686 RepID=A0A9W4D8K3_BLUGR|nr:BgTH12-01284 [Blumeria graminis f. sp. triticale]